MHRAQSQYKTCITPFGGMAPTGLAGSLRAPQTIAVAEERVAGWG